MKRAKPTKAKQAEPLPLCVQAMGCLCAAHALGREATGPCDANEEAMRAEYETRKGAGSGRLGEDGCYDEPSPIEKLDALIEELENDLPYRSDGGETDRLNYSIVASLRVARVGLALAYPAPDLPNGAPRWPLSQEFLSARAMASRIADRKRKAGGGK
jgi:hypothetical protein